MPKNMWAAPPPYLKTTTSWPQHAQNMHTANTAKAQAVRLYSLAAAQGAAPAQNSLGNLFENGKGVAQDRSEAIRWFHLAAAQGYADAQTSLKRLKIKKSSKQLWRHV